MPVVPLAVILAAPAQGSPAGRACIQAAAGAEREWAIPPGLLLAVGLAESGQRDPASARLEPYPWAINVGGADVSFAGASYAIDAVVALRARGVASIDVGCFQVNLHFHPDAFQSVPGAFDPAVNATYAARFLRTLFERTGSWDAAVASYHSADPARGGPYRDRVMRLWRGLVASRATSITPRSVSPAPAEPAAAPVPFGTVTGPVGASADPYVIRSVAGMENMPIYTAATLPPVLRAQLLAGSVVPSVPPAPHAILSLAP